MKIEKLMDKDELIKRKAKCEGMAEAYKGYSFLGLGVPFMAAFATITLEKNLELKSN
jgi:hypothetical protein